MNLARKAVRSGLIALGLSLAAAVVAPFIHADRFSRRIHAAIERAVGRRVEMGDIRFTLLMGPGFSIDRVVIHEDSSFGPEPVAYVGTLHAGVRLWSLWTGRLDFRSITLEDTSINLMKSEDGAWNFERLLNRANLSQFPNVAVRNGRFNFKFGQTKSTFYLTQADADLWPPPRSGEAWSLWFEAAPARTDKPARAFGQISGRGRWALGGAAPGVDLEIRLNNNMLADVSSLVRGYDAGVHGEVSARIHLKGPLNNVRISGSAAVRDVHRWDMILPDTGGWPIAVKGRLDTVAQTIELEAAGGEAIPVSMRLRARDYRSRPKWGLAFTMKRFPVNPLIQLARHMGIALPEGVRLAGWVEGALGYTPAGGFQGEFGFQETRLDIPGTPPLSFEQARLLFDGSRVALLPAAVSTPDHQSVRLEGAWKWVTGDWEVGIGTAGMALEVLRAQASLAAVPWMEQLRSGRWTGDLRYRSNAGWSGRAGVSDAVLPVAGVSQPVRVESAQVRIDGARVALDKLRLACGDIEAEGNYVYEPDADRPHRFRLAVAEADAAALESLFGPALRRQRSSLIARALRLGRAPVPQWLAGRRAEGSLAFGVLRVAGVPFERVRTQASWDGTRVTLDNLHARLGPGGIDAVAAINLRGSAPEYRIHGRWRGVEWQSGIVQGEGIVETTGTGVQLLANLRAAGIFNGAAIELPDAGDAANVKGAYELGWTPTGPRIRLAALHLTKGGDVYAGRGHTADDGRLIIELASGIRELRMSGTLARLHADAPAAP
jgi:hypothetical protein